MLQLIVAILLVLALAIVGARILDWLEARDARRTARCRQRKRKMRSGSQT